MQPFLSENFKSKIENQYIFLDNDFLSLVFKDEIVFKEIFIILDNTTIMIDTYTKFEFLRDIYIPEDRITRERFINQDLFHITQRHPETLEKIWENAQILSRIYAHKGRAKGISFVDLMLAGRMMIHNNTLLLSGNKKDFPSSIFNSEGTICFEDQENTHPKTFWLMSFNKEKFKNCFSNLNDLEKSSKRNLEKHLKKLKEEKA